MQPTTNNNIANEVLAIHNNDADYLDFATIVAFVVQNKRRLLLDAVVGTLLGLSLALLLPKQWEAKALIRVGQLGSVGSMGQLAEPILQVVDRIKNNSFQNDVLTKLNISTDEDDEVAENFRDTLKPKAEKSDLVSISLKAYSRDSAQNHLTAVVNELKLLHAKISAPTIARWHQELDAIDSELNKANAETARLTKSLEGQGDELVDKKFSQAALLSNILISRESELRNFRDRKRVLQEQLSPERTFETATLGRVEVSKKAVLPKKSLFIFAGLMLGLIIGLVISIVKPSVVADSVNN